MTSLERLMAVVRGESPDRKPVIRWPAPPSEWFNAASQSDAVIDARDAAEVRSRFPGAAVLAAVMGPFGRALADGANLVSELRADPEAGELKLSHYFELSRREISGALSGGADGVLYLLVGASERRCTPMQYGGYFLERDRELLEHALGASFNLLFVVGGEGVYLDAVSDLPAHALGWDFEATGIPASAVRRMREGALCSQDPESDIALAPGTLGGPIESFVVREVANAAS